jgi:S-adenosylmethionine:tRNA ribosyltransferase-isomerase
LKTSDFYYDLPKELIAQTPAPVRSQSRLLIYNRTDGSITDGVFTDVLQHLHPGDVLVRNNTRVIPARLIGHRPETGGTMEFLLLSRLEGDTWECLCKPAKRAKVGMVYEVTPELSVKVLGDAPMDGGKRVELLYDGIFEEVLDRAGQMPLPPYITERLEDKERYQTVYAVTRGSAAAPTAGLHFTPELLDTLAAQGVPHVFVTLHVGPGTFRPVKAENIEDHEMHAEYCVIPAQTAQAVTETKKRGGRVIAVGTTSCRTLESFAAEDGTLSARSGWTDIFIYPGYRFKCVDALVTNFHLPESTLIMLVSALAGRENVLRAYEEAVAERYRFFSFGDAMFIH